ncbi:uncharacterized protein BX664DRAFT_382718 [Halteromyces radiatus]|uniref:uncharacterized protein n=1 Tax=Halteromyces radiatus TaxID=101107 RepID=UPI00221F0613|nr:uncharacterized protein BX664DRAFT_382718 [Halteromyces radiatus]KAI8096242.1 hypothetical protein BX664DRAFT_382718 [Halteromyces radiatus]
MTTTLQLQEQWLPTLSSIIVDSDSFSKDLIRQFDKKRSRLHAEMGGDSISLSTDSIHSRARTPETNIESEARPPIPNLTIMNQNEEDKHLRRRSAGDLLRRSSAYLRAKFEQFKSTSQQQEDLTILPPPEEQRRSVFQSWSLSKKNQQQKQPHVDTIFNPPSHQHLSSSLGSSSSLTSSSQQPTKIAINTTISLPPPVHPPLPPPQQQQQQQQQRHASLYHYTAAVHPPVITQYPPRPLKYAPVEPFSDDHAISTNNNNNKQFLSSSTHHRISLPLFRILQDTSSHRQVSRRSSESDIQHHLETTSSSWTRRFSQWLGCHTNKTAKKGKEKLSTTTPTTTTNIEGSSLVA